jgi:hypothetical protein
MSAIIPMVATTLSFPEGLLFVSEAQALKSDVTVNIAKANFFILIPLFVMCLCF